MLNSYKGMKKKFLNSNGGIKADGVPNVLYLYSGARKDKFKGKIGIDYPDTQFYGLNHLNKFGIFAEYKEWSDISTSRFLSAVLSFRIKHLLLYYFTGGRDVVFGSSLLYMMIFKKLFRKRTKFVMLNIGIMRTLKANKKSKIKYALMKWLLKELDGVVCLARCQKEYLENEYSFLMGKVFFVPLGVDTDYYQPEYKNRKDYILSAGRDNGRDYKTVIETARLMPEREFHIVCSKRNLEGVNTIPKNVKIFYDMPSPELHKKYREAKMLLLITHDDLFRDGADCSGQTVLLDAMASGLPVIASRKKYLADYAEDQKEAVFVDFYDCANIKVAVESLLDNKGFRRNIAMRARQRVENEFSTEKMAKGLSGIFLSLP